MFYYTLHAALRVNANATCVSRFAVCVLLLVKRKKENFLLFTSLEEKGNKNRVQGAIRVINDKQVTDWVSVCSIHLLTHGKQHSSHGHFCYFSAFRVLSLCLLCFHFLSCIHEYIQHWQWGWMENVLCVCASYMRDKLVTHRVTGVSFHFPLALGFQFCHLAIANMKFTCKSYERKEEKVRESRRRIWV